MITGVTRRAIARLLDEYTWEPTTVEAMFLSTKRRRGVDWWGELDEVEFLDRLFDLDELPSTDERFDSARGDIIQHRIANFDWQEDSWILTDDRFLRNDSQLVQFLAETLHPEVRTDTREVNTLRSEYNRLLRPDGYEVRQSGLISGRPVYAGGAAVARPVSSDELRDGIGQSIRHAMSATHVPAFCDSLSMPPLPEGSLSDPMSSKAAYVVERITDLDRAALIDLSRRVLDREDSEALSELLFEIDMAAGPSVTGAPKNLIFAANGPKPELVLLDAVNNDIEITKNAQFCLIYDRDIDQERGIRWQDLVDWWAELTGQDSTKEVARELHRRLLEGLNPPEQLLLNTYATLYRSMGFDIPALIPQVYLHFDPLTKKQRGGPGPLERQRMDFLLLLPRRQRVVVELDGKQHYTDSSGEASPSAYAAMVSEDRRLQLDGYSVYRFGGYEFVDQDKASRKVEMFFRGLFELHNLTA